MSRFSRTVFRSLSGLTSYAPELAVLIVDNGSYLSGKEFLENLSMALVARIITPRCNAGYAAGNNIGIREVLESYA